jgi:hypothetical protein
VQYIGLAEEALGLSHAIWLSIRHFFVFKKSSATSLLLNYDNQIVKTFLRKVFEEF